MKMAEPNTAGRMKTFAELERERLEITHRHIWNNAMCRGGARPRPPDTSALDAQIRAARERQGKAFWQRTQKQVWAAMHMPAEKHRGYVEAALREGKDVPAEVLQDYPDLRTPRKRNDGATGVTYEDALQ